MTTAREIMTAGAECIGENDTLEVAARRMREEDVGALPVCGEDNRIKGIVTDRDIVIKCLAAGDDPKTVKAGELAEGKPVTIGADDSVEEALQTMKEHKVRRLPVIDGRELIGMLAQADAARALSDASVADLLEVISD